MHSAYKRWSSANLALKILMLADGRFASCKAWFNFFFESWTNNLILFLNSFCLIRNFRVEIKCIRCCLISVYISTYLSMMSLDNKAYLLWKNIQFQKWCKAISIYQNYNNLYLLMFFWKKLCLNKKTTTRKITNQKKKVTLQNGWG